MYKHEYQGGPFVEILSTQGKNPLNKWRVSGGNSALKKIYERDVKSYVYCLEGTTATSKLLLPKDGTKQSLSLTQRYLILQAFIPSGKDFSVETSMTDTTNSKRRLVMSTSIRDISITPLHAKLNLSIVKRDSWLNLCFDMGSLLSEVFSRQIYKSLDSITLAGNCKIRKVFTMRNQPPDTTDYSLDFSSGDGTSPVYGHAELESIPSSLQFAPTVTASTQLVNVQKVLGYLKSHMSQDMVSSHPYDHLDGLLQGKRQQPPIKSSRSTKNSARTSSKRGHLDRLSSQESGFGRNQRTQFDAAERQRRADNVTVSDENGVGRGPKVLSARVQGTPMSLKSSTIQNSERTKAVAIQKHSLSVPKSRMHDPVEVIRSPGGGQFSQNLNMNNNGVFSFSSRPHSAHRQMDSTPSPTPPCRVTIPSGIGVNLEDDFAKSDGSDSDDDITDRILRNTPSPSSRKTASQVLQSRKFSPIGRLSRQSVHGTKYAQSPRNRTYNSAKFTSKPTTDERDYQAVDSDVSRVGNINRHSVTSLHGSDATLTASVDTLVLNSTSKGSNSGDPDDSLDRHRNSHSDDSLEENTLPQGMYSGTLGNTKLSPLSEGNTSHRSVTISRKTLREIPQNSLNVQRRSQLPESSTFQVGEWSESFEAQMLSDMRREHEEEMLLEEHKTNRKNNPNAHESTLNNISAYEDAGSGDESFDASWSTWKQPLAMQSEAYKAEMEGCLPVSKDMETLAISLNRSNPRDWGNLFSPPIILPSERAQQEKDALSDVESGSASDVLGYSGGSTTSGRSPSVQESDEEEMLDLMYDPELNCYFDPRNGRYYELKG